MQEILLWLVLAVCVIICIVQALLLRKFTRQSAPETMQKEELDKLRAQLTQLGASVQTSQDSASQYFERMAKLLREDAQHAAAAQEEKMDFISDRTRHDLGEIRKSSESLTLRTEERLRTFATENEALCHPPDSPAGTYADAAGTDKTARRNACSGGRENAEGAR